MDIDNLTVDVTALVGEEAVRKKIIKIASDLAADVSILRGEVLTRELIPIETMALNAICNAYEKVLSGRRSKSES